jgi:hypothetical protein
MILKLDRATFPEAFAPEGRQRRAEILETVSALERERAVRIGRHVRGPLAGEPREVRLGAAELSRAYALAQPLDYEPLAVGLSRMEHQARRLALQTKSEPARSFLEKLAGELPCGDLAAIGMGRSRFKQEWRALAPALTAAVALMDGIAPAWERVVSERLFRDSKLLGRVRHHVINLLLRMDPQWEGIPPEDAAEKPMACAASPD